MRRRFGLLWIVVCLVSFSGFGCTVNLTEDDLLDDSDSVVETGTDSEVDTGTGPADTGTGPADTGTGPADTGTGPADTGTGEDTDSDEDTADTGVDTGVDTGIDTGVDTGVDTGIDTGVDPGCDTGCDTDSDTDVDTGTGTDVDTGTETDVDTDVDTGTETDVDTDVDTGTETDVDTDVDTGTETDMDTGTETDVDTGTSVDTGQDTDWDDETLCSVTGGTWDADSCGGHWMCGMPPVCDLPPHPTPIPVIPGCDCGGGKVFDAANGCVDGAMCTALDCSNLRGFNSTWGLSNDIRVPPLCTLESPMGWAVIDDVCTEILGCPDELPYFPMFASRDECHLGCDTRQEICMTTGGVWMYELACDNYYCGVGDDQSCASEDLYTVCNCGPDMNYVDGVGCLTDPACPPNTGDTCPTYDFNIDYTASCGPFPVAGHYGLRDGVCGTIFGCPADFDPVTGFVDPADWFTSLDECLNACAGCTSDSDCDTASGEICQFAQETNCGAWGTGTCSTPNAVCSQIYDPVCGCDGSIVSSHCHLNTGNGNSLAYDGECFNFPAEPDTDTDTGLDTDWDDESLCSVTGGTWDADSCGGHWMCGMPPICDLPPHPTPVPVIPGCDCGGGKVFDAVDGCGDGAMCTALNCSNLGEFNSTWGLSNDIRVAPLCNLQGTMGWAVVDDVCTEILGCPDELPYFPMFASRDECHLGCDTRQEICMTTGGVWMHELACDNYYCGVGDDQSCASEDLYTVCNCGPDMNYVDGVGCLTDPACPPNTGDTCPTYDFNIDYTASCGPFPVAGHYGLRDGVCGTIFGCPADFDPVTGFVDPADWFTSLDECLNACAGCTSDSDCDTASGEMCQFAQETNCGAWGTGICISPSAVCSQVYDPVCGCDGSIVSSHCHLNVGSGNSLAYDGECFLFP